MANTKLQPIAMFMICLIVTLPIYISSVYADINSVRGYGEAGAENFVTKQYDLMVEADVSLDGKNITPEQLKIRHEEGLYTYFDSCVSKSNSTDYLCKISGIRSATSEIELCPSSSFNIELYEDKFSTTPVDVETLPIKCDAKPPSLILSVSPHLSKGENISLSYEAHDPENSQTKCSGVDKLEIYPNGLEGGAATILMNSTSCYQSGRVPIVASDYSDDKFIIYVKAYDRLGQSSMANTTFIVDKTGPDASASISITDLSGKTVEYFRPQTILADVILNISDLAGVEDYNLDYSGLTSTAPICSSVVTDVICEWTNIQLHMDNAEFSRKIIMQAEDVLGNNATREITVETSVKQDLNPPQISNFKILRLDGKNMGGENISRWIPDEEFSAKAYIDVSDKGSGLDSVNGDFSIINPLYSDYLIGDCNQISKTGNESLPEYKYRCSWDLNVHFNTSGNPLNAQFRINATDNALNYATPTFTKSFNVDVDGPVVTKLKTNWFFDNVYYVGTGGNSFTATIRDDGIGISTDVYLDADSIRLGNNVKADNCSGSFCYWHLQGVAGAEEGLHAVSVKTNTMDSLGNNMDEPFALNVMLDSTAPVLNSINVTPVAANTELFQDFIQTGNALYIVADITESTSLLSATGDFSEFISDETSDLADSCERQEDEEGKETDRWICTWTTDEIDIEGYKKDNVYLNITDVAGNSLVYSLEIEVLEALEGVYNFWDYNVVDNSPNAIDRQIVTYYNPSMWFTIDLTSTEGKLASQRWPLDVVVDKCFSDVTDSSGTPTVNYISSSAGNLPLLINPNVVGATTLPYSLYLNYELEQSAPTDSSIEITCTLKIKTLVDNQKISPYEYENITVTISYYNNPLGEIEANIQQEIDEIKEGWLVSSQWVGTITKLMNILSGLCGLVNKVIKLSGLLGGIADALSIPWFTKPASSAVGTAASSMEDLSGALWQGVNKFCKFLNCQLYYGADWGGGEGQKGMKGFFAGGEDVSNPLATVGRLGKKYERHFNPKESIVLSIAFLCLPGILYNLQKARAVDCQYVRCLKSTATGMPVQFCVKQRDYGWCAYVWGQVFNTMPFRMLYRFTGYIKNMLQSPAQFISVIVKGICHLKCEGTTGLCSSCIIISSLDLFVDVLCDLGIGGDHCEPFWNDLTVDNSACDGLFDEDEDEDEDED